MEIDIMLNQKDDIVEILGYARYLIIENDKTLIDDAHNRWLIQKELLWNIRNINLPYPNIKTELKEAK